MPIPILAWAAMAAGAAGVAWYYRKEISAFFDSPAGQSLLKAFNEAAAGAMAPYQRLVEEAYTMDTTKRREFLRQAKARMSRDNWVMFVGYCEGLPRLEPRYLATCMDVARINKEA